jgi:hypothetical protein
MIYVIKIKRKIIKIKNIKSRKSRKKPKKKPKKSRKSRKSRKKSRKPAGLKVVCVLKGKKKLSILKNQKTYPTFSKINFYY